MGESDEKMFRLRLQQQMGQAEALKNVRILRKDRARMMTILRERELSEKDPLPTALAREVLRSERVVGHGSKSGSPSIQR